MLEMSDTYNGVKKESHCYCYLKIYQVCKTGKTAKHSLWDKQTHLFEIFDGKDNTSL